MKTIHFLLMLIILSAGISSAQTYVEITDNGWGYGKSISKPTFADIDDDGLLDLLVGGWDRYIQHYEQTESGSTTFQRVTEKFLHVPAADFAAPCLIDIDGDDRLDLIIGYDDGSLYHYEQETPGSYTFLLISEMFNDIDVGRYSTPCFTDLDGDGLIDMVIGENEGDLHLYEQDSANSYSFTLISDSLSNISVGYQSTPFFTDLDNDGLLDLIVGSSEYCFFHFEQESAGSISFILISDDFNEINVGGWPAPCFIDLDNNGLLDMICGSGDGYLYHYEQHEAGSMAFDFISMPFITGLIDAGGSAKPFIADVDGDGLLDMLTGQYSGRIRRYEQAASGSGQFILVAEEFSGLYIGIYSAPWCVDLDNDGLLDLLAGDFNGDLKHYEQEAPNSATFNHVTDTFCEMPEGRHLIPCVQDIDNNGLLDLLVGEDDGNINHYRQEETGSTHFTLVTENFNGIDIKSKPSPCFTDLDNDGLLDMIIGNSQGKLQHYEQNAAGSFDFTLISSDFLNVDWKGDSSPVFADINNDGWEDLLMGSNSGGVSYFQRIPETGIDDEIRPDSFQLLSGFPNPFNPVTTIQYHLSRPSHVTISFYNISGQRIKILENRMQTAGVHEIQWDGTDEDGRLVGSGTYICRMQTETSQQSIKLLFLK